MEKAPAAATWLCLLGAAALFAGGASAQTAASPASAPPPPPPPSDQAPPDLDPHAIDLLRAATDYLAAQQTLSVDWFISRDHVLDGREKLTDLSSGGIVLDRDDGFVAHSEAGPKSRAYYYDRTTFSILDIENDSYVAAPFDGELEEIVERVKTEYDMVLPVWSVLSRGAADDFIDAADKAAYVELTRISGRAAHHLAFSNYDYDWQVWVAADEERPEILMIVGTDPYSQGWPQYRAYFSNWDFAPQIDPAEFTYVPDETAERMAWPKVAEAPAGTE